MRCDLKAHLTELAKTNELFYRPNIGNAGDSLIACATFQLFEKNRIPYQLVDDESFDPVGKVVIYGGGGNLVSGRYEARRFLERVHLSATKLVVLPHTISGHEDFLGQLGSNVDLFAREEVSFEYLRRYALRANLFLGDDLAFELDPMRILEEELPRPYRHLPLKQLVRRDAALLREVVRRSYSRDLVLNCFRTDKERTDIRLPANNVDVSKLFKCGTETPPQAFVSTHMVFRLINHYDAVRTNRLHLAIAGAVLGKEVQFYSNSYYKCEAVYNFSMKDRFPNVQWMG